jgi:hypothetical protein
MQASFWFNILIAVLFGFPNGVYGAASSSSDVPDRKHGQFIILVDSLENSENEHVAVVRSFATAITTLFVPFMASESIVHNFLTRNGRADTKKDRCCNKSVDWSRWDVYKIPDAPFMYFVPKVYIATHRNSGLLLLDEDRITFDPKSFARQTKQQKSDVEFYANLLRRVFQLRSKTSIQPHEHDLKIKEALEEQAATELLEEQKRLPVWDIIIHGHGNLTTDVDRPEESANVAGVSVKTMKDMMKFFTNEIYVNTLFIETCSAGGQNANLLQFDKAIGNDTLININFEIIVGAISDDPTWVDDATEDKWDDFFRYAESALSLSDMLKILGSAQQRHAGSPHASSNIPQIWVPGGYGFQTYQIDDRIKVLSKVLVSAREDEQKAIRVPNTTEVVLVYPKKISVPIEVGLFSTQVANADELSLRESAWKNVPAAGEILLSLPNERISTLNDAPALARMMTENPNYKSDMQSFMSKRNKYPRFISMLKGINNEHQLDRIELETQQDKETPIGGVMQFIRDAFIPSITAETQSNQIFLIKELIGINDISLLLELVRAKTSNAVSDLELALRPFIGQRITLNNVNVGVSPRFVTIKFEFHDTRWNAFFRYPDIGDDIRWRFSSSAVAQGSPITGEPREQLPISGALEKKLAILQSQGLVSAESSAALQKKLMSIRSKKSISADTAPEASRTSANKPAEQLSPYMRAFKNIAEFIYRGYFNR